MSKFMIDPPSGWRYGFPRAVPEEVLTKKKSYAEWFLECGYPENEIEFALQYCRHWTQDDTLEDIQKKFDQLQTLKFQLEKKDYRFLVGKKVRLKETAVDKFLSEAKDIGYSTRERNILKKRPVGVILDGWYNGEEFTIGVDFGAGHTCCSITDLVEE